MQSLSKTTIGFHDDQGDILGSVEIEESFDSILDVVEAEEAMEVGVPSLPNSVPPVVRFLRLIAGQVLLELIQDATHGNYYKGARAVTIS